MPNTLDAIEEMTVAQNAPVYVTMNRPDGTKTIVHRSGTVWEVLPGDLNANYPNYRTSTAPSQAVTPSPRDLIRRFRMRSSHARRIRLAGTAISIPAVLHRFGDAIKSSRSILDLEDDWDDEGAKGYQRSTWLRAITFLVEASEWSWEVLGEVVPTPKINPGPDGSIDLDWSLPGRELLINIPENGDQPAGFYGDDGNLGSPIEGKFNADESNGWIMAWLMGA